jgi:hypothetical protein
MARMPSTRAQPLNPRLAPSPSRGAVVRPVPVAAQPHLPAPQKEVVDEADAREEEARAGGFHESSYELKQGLDIVESEWPDDVTTPGVLGRR